MSALRALGGGLIGAGVLTLLHEIVRHSVPEAPRMDALGRQSLARLLHGAGLETPEENELHAAALVGDIVSNGIYYSLVGAGNSESAGIRGALLGLAAGVGAVTLPEPLGLSKEASNRSPATAAMTIGLYLAGGLAAAAAYRALEERE